MISGVYIIENTMRPNAVYVGSSVDLWNRRRNHFACLKRGNHRSQKLQRAFNKYGEEAFVFRIVALCPVECLLEIEQSEIERRNSVVDGYNICPNAGNTIGRKHSEDTRKKLGDRQRGLRRPPEWCRHISEGLRGNRHSVGRHLSPEHKKALLNGARNRKISPKKRQAMVEHLRRLSAKMTHEQRVALATYARSCRRPGYHHSDETKQKMRVAAIGRKHTEEAKKNMSKAALKRESARREQRAMKS